jgi:hypothetical protein
VNAILGAAYRSMESGHWEPVRTDATLLGTPATAAGATPAAAPTAG